MAQTIREIYDELLAEKAAMTSLNALTGVDSSQTLLNKLSSTGKVATWSLWLWVCAWASWIVQQYHDLHKKEVDTILTSQVPGTAAWCAWIMTQFQYGSELVKLAIPGYEEEFADPDESKRIFRLGYSPIDTDLRIISQSSASEAQGIIRVKVAKGVPGALEKLTEPELEAARAYADKVFYAGTHRKITSGDPDLMKLKAKIVYDPMVFNPDGTIKADDTTRPVDDVINGYLQDLPFDGTFMISELNIRLNAIPGVIDAQAFSIYSKYGALDYTLISMSRKPDAGYFQIDPAFPLTNTTFVQYIANV